MKKTLTFHFKDSFPFDSDDHEAQDEIQSSKHNQYSFHNVYKEKEKCVLTLSMNDE